MKAANDAVPCFMPDTNCLVALLLPQHEHHERAFREMERRLDDGERLAIAAHTLVETYAVLTRFPSPHRLSSVDCRTLIEANFFGDGVTLCTLPAEAYRELIRDAPE